MAEVSEATKVAVLTSAMSKPDVQGLDAVSAKGKLLEWLKTGNKTARVMLEKEIRQLDRDMAMARIEGDHDRLGSLATTVLNAKRCKGTVERKMAVAVRQVKHLQKELRTEEKAGRNDFANKMRELPLLGVGALSGFLAFTGSFAGVAVSIVTDASNAAANSIAGIGAAGGAIILPALILALVSGSAISRWIGRRKADRKELEEATK